MTIKISKGPASHYEARFNELEDLIDFRLVLDYHIGTDTIMTRFDVKASEESWHNAVLTSVPPRWLKIPKHGVDGALGVSVNRQDLIEALRGLADALERDKLVIQWDRLPTGDEVVKEQSDRKARDLGLPPSDAAAGTYKP